jgi:single-stranded DNA-binding protein
MNREVHVRFCESAGLRCPALLTYVEGRLRTRAWEPSDGGSKQYRTEIVALNVQFLGARPTDVPQSDIEPPSGTIDEDAPF